MTRRASSATDRWRQADHISELDECTRHAGPIRAWLPWVPVETITPSDVERGIAACAAFIGRRPNVLHSETSADGTKTRLWFEWLP